MTEPQFQGPPRRRPAVTVLRWAAFGLLASVGAGLVFLVLVLTLYTDPAPRPLPPVQLSESGLDDLASRIAVFQQALRQEENAGPLLLRSPEINALLFAMPGSPQVREYLRVEIHTNALWTRLSLPLSQLSRGALARLLSARFLNADAHLTVSVRHGLLDVRLLDLQVRGRQVPRWLTAPLRRKNLAQSVNDDARAAMALEKIDRVEVGRDYLRIYPVRFTEDSG